MNSQWKHPLSAAHRWLGGLLNRSSGADEARAPEQERPDELEQALGYRFVKLELVYLALTHPSAAEGTDQHYERLEFLGDAVLDLAIADMLMSYFPTGNEGLLSRQRASIVNARTLASKAESIGLGYSLRLGKGEEKSGGRQKTSILAACFEALIGAIYIDQGLHEAKRVVEGLFADDIGGPAVERDYKTELQETAHRMFRAHPSYEVIQESGPDHAKRFVTSIRIGEREMGTGEGASKKQSEQAAAREALRVLNGSAAQGIDNVRRQG